MPSAPPQLPHHHNFCNLRVDSQWRQTEVEPTDATKDMMGKVKTAPRTETGDCSTGREDRRLRLWLIAARGEHRRPLAQPGIQIGQNRTAREDHRRSQSSVSSALTRAGLCLDGKRTREREEWNMWGTMDRESGHKLSIEKMHPESPLC